MASALPAAPNVGAHGPHGAAGRGEKSEGKSAKTDKHGTHTPQFAAMLTHALGAAPAKAVPTGGSGAANAPNPSAKTAAAAAPAKRAGPSAAAVHELEKPPATTLEKPATSVGALAPSSPDVKENAPTFKIAPVPPPAPIAKAVAQDPGLTAAIFPRMANVSLDAGDLGRLSLHLRVHDGGALDVRASGAAAPLVATRGPELVHALAEAGFTLGSFESEGRGQQQRPDAPPDHRPPPPPRPAETSTAAAAPGHIHVEA